MNAPLSLYTPMARWWVPRVFARRIGAAFAVLRGVDKVNLGGDYATPENTAPGYSLKEAMSSFGGLAWVYACAHARAEDLASLALYIERGPKGDAVRLDSHPFLELMLRPNSTDTEEEYRRQLYVDGKLTGNAYSVILGKGIPVGLLRLHPERITIRADKYSGIGAFVYDGRGDTETFDPADMLHVRYPSWESGPQGLFGQGAIRAMHLDLSTEVNAQRLAADQSSRGRPDVLLAPGMDEGVWNPQTRKEVLAAYQDLWRGRSGGAMAAPTATKVEHLNLTPRDMEFTQLRLLVRDTVMSVMGVPPARLGLPSANYATQRQQMKTYWESLRGDARLYSAQWSKVAAAMGNPQDRVMHDFSQVEALQLARTERLQRVGLHLMNGVDTASAYTMEGFEAPVLAPMPEPLPQAPAQPEEQPQEQVEPAEERAVLEAWWAGMLVADKADRSTPAGRTEIWDWWVRNVHTPAERRIYRDFRRYMRQAADRTAERLAEAMRRRGRTIEQLQVMTKDSDGYSVLQRDLTDDLVEEAVGALQEMRILMGGVGLLLQERAERAFRLALASMQLSGLAFDRTGAEYARLPKDFSKRITSATATLVRSTIETGLAEGWTISEMQSQLVQDKAFDFARSRRVARTEATRAVTVGTQASYAAAESTGLKVQKEWLTSKDAAVRESHRSLDGQVRSLDEAFETSGGAMAMGPGLFESPGEVINCRCTTLPVVTRSRSEDV